MVVFHDFLAFLDYMLVACFLCCFASLFLTCLGIGGKEMLLFRCVGPWLDRDFSYLVEDQALGRPGLHGVLGNWLLSHREGANS